MSELSTLEEVQTFVLRACAPLRLQRIPISLATDHVLAEDIVANESVPPFTNSAMDGFAIRVEDATHAPCHLAIVGELMAGEASCYQVQPGEAIRIMTGAPIPDGADAVCPIEDVRANGQSILIERPIPLGKNIRLAGEDIAEGKVVFREGTVLGPAHIGVLASLGIERVAVHSRPRVGVLSTGDELVAPPVPLGPGQIRDANRSVLLSLLAQANFETIDLGIVGDDEEELADALAEASDRCDAVISSGGVSVGDRDAVRDVIEMLATVGTARSFEVAIRPAKPFTFGMLRGQVPAFGLPGNPVATMIAYELFCRPALLRLAGKQAIHRPRFVGIADEKISRRSDGKVHFVRVVAFLDDGGHLHVRSGGAQNPHMLHAMAGSNALAVVADGSGIDVGQEVQLILVDPERLNTVS